MNNPHTLISIAPELAEALRKASLVADSANQLRDAYAPHFQALHEAMAKAKVIQPDQPRAAREVRLEVRAVRIACEKTRVSLKADSLARGKAIDGIYNVLEFQVAPIEEALLAIEQAEERAAFARIQALKAQRSEELRPYADPTFYDLGSMPEPAWQQLITGARAAKAAQEEAFRKAEADRIAREQAAKDERIRQEAVRQAEVDRLREETRIAHEAAAVERAKREAQEEEARQERMRAAAHRQLQEQEAENIRAAEREEHRRKQADLEAQAQADRDRAAAAEAKLAKQRAADAEKKRKDQAAAKRAAAAPDRAKLEALATQLRAIPVPAIASEPLRLQIEDAIASLAKFITTQSQKLGE